MRYASDMPQSSESSCRASFCDGCDDGVGQRFQTVNVAFDPIPRLQRPHPGGSAGVDQIARAQLKQSGQLSDNVRHIPDHFADVRLLLGLAVDLEPDVSTLDMAQ